MSSSGFRSEHLVFWLSLLAILALSCTRYFKPVPLDTGSPQVTGNVISTKSQEKFLILRQGNFSYELDNVSFNDDTTVLHATLRQLDPAHRQYVDAKRRKYGYTGKLVLKEMHIYTKDSSAPDLSKPYTLPVDQIAKMEIIEHDKGRTRTSYIIGIGITTGAFIGVVAFIWNNASYF